METKKRCFGLKRMGRQGLKRKYPQLVENQSLQRLQELEEAEERNEAGKELEKDIHGLYACNALPGSKVANLLVKSAKAGISFQNAFAKTKAQLAKAKLKAASERGDTNAARTLKNWHKRKSQWGHLYWAKIPVWDRKTKQARDGWHPFLLPHEWLNVYLTTHENFMDALPEAGSARHKQLATAASAWESFTWEMTPLGLHGDGVPVQGRMNQDSLDFVTLNLPCSSHSQLRVPFTCVEKRFNAGNPTIKAIFEILKWSLHCLAVGKNPTHRHDETEWLKLEKARKKNAGTDLSAKCCLIEIRADWDWFQHWMAAPAWNQGSGMCWLCKACPATWRSLDKAARESQSLSKAEFLESVKTREKMVCPLFDLPGVTNQLMFPDWMHVMDEGFGALVAGQILHYLLPFYPGNSAAKRVEKLWEHIQSLYKAEKTPACNRLYKLTVKDIVKPKKPAELDVKAAHCRHFMGFLPKLAKAKFGADVSAMTNEQKAVQALAQLIAQVYDHLEKNEPEKLAKAGERAIKQYLALETATKFNDSEDVKTWHCKPKCHLFGHLCDRACKGWNPKDSWNYRDETFAFTMATMGFKRAGPDKKSMAETILIRWMSSQQWPSLQRATSYK